MIDSNFIKNTAINISNVSRETLKELDDYGKSIISKKDVIRQYIAYHEGWGNFKNYKSNTKVINLAKRVEKQSNIYKKQLAKCKNSLSTPKYIIF